MQIFSCLLNITHKPNAKICLICRKLLCDKLSVPWSKVFCLIHIFTDQIRIFSLSPIVDNLEWLFRYLRVFLNSNICHTIVVYFFYALFFSIVTILFKINKCIYILLYEIGYLLLKVLNKILKIGLSYKDVLFLLTVKNTLKKIDS